jgi:hypothetical protein
MLVGPFCLSLSAALYAYTDMETRTGTTMLLGKSSNAAPFLLPADAVARKFAVIGMSGSGKTCAVAKIAEKMYEAGLPWIAFDTLGNWWGLKALKNGEPSEYKIIVIGGEHADIPLKHEKGYAAKIAEVLCREAVCTVIDLSQETKAVIRSFVSEFCAALMNLKPAGPRHLFVEESPEFVPQKTPYRDMQLCKSEMERLIRLGRNKGYGITLVSQRAATVDKDALSQCENLFIMRLSHKHDRKALRDWIEAQSFNESDVEECFSNMASLADGEAYFWSPQWLRRFCRMKFNERKTFHPGDTRTAKEVDGKSVRLCNVEEFRVRVDAALSEAASSETNEEEEKEEKKEKKRKPVPVHPVRREDDEEKTELKSRLAAAVNERQAAEDRLNRITSQLRGVLSPFHEVLNDLFTEFDAASAGKKAGTPDKSKYDVWLKKAPKEGIRKILESLIENRHMTRHQLCAVVGINPNSTYYDYIGWLRKVGLVKTTSEGADLVEL